MKALLTSAAALATALTFAPARAGEPTRVVEITAKRFEFTPNVVTLERGKPIVLRLHTEDVTHGFFSKPLRIEADIAPGKPTDVALTPDAPGTYTVICDHFCGAGHGNMKMKIVVE